MEWEIGSGEASCKGKPVSLSVSLLFSAKREYGGQRAKVTTGKPNLTTSAVFVDEGLLVGARHPYPREMRPYAVTVSARAPSLSRTVCLDSGGASIVASYGACQT